MNDRYRPLLPAHPSANDDEDASGSASGPGGDTTLTRKRRAVHRACDPCRTRKERCDGRRPACGPCTRRETQCIYSAFGGDELGALKSRNESLEVENNRWRELYSLLRRLPEAEARQALARIRDADDPIAVLNFTTQASASTGSPAPQTEPGSNSWNPRVETLNLKTLSESPIRVHARPWTAIAGNGLVSQLISSFFMWDNAFSYPFVDREAFLGDMRSGDAKGAKYCSPFLVNAICASRCFTSARAKSFSAISGRDVGTQFLDEAKKLFDLELGRASLPTVQGLTLLYTLSAHHGVDRAGMAQEIGSEEDLKRRRELYAAVVEWSKNMPERMKEESVLAPQTCFLRIYMDEVLISILRPLSPEIIFENELSVKDLCLQCAETDTLVMEQYMQNFSLNDYSCMALCGPYNTVLTVARHLDDATARDMFSRASMILHCAAGDFPMVKFILQGVKVMAWAMGFRLPAEAKQYFKDLGSGKEELKDIPLAFTLPPAAAVREFLSGEEEEGVDSASGIEMGLLLSKWSALSIDDQS
ncbi:hypothetical protein ACHAPT_013411 [Fusarium lateritium]